MTNGYATGLALALVAALAAPGLSPGALAQPAAAAPARRITFDEALAIALRQNVSVRQARNATELSSAAVQQQRLALLPDFRLNSSTGQSYGRTFIQDQGGIVNQTANQFNAGVASSVTVFNGLSNVNNLAAARRSDEATDRDYTRTRQTVVFTVASQFLTLLSQQEQVRVQEENLAALEAQQAQIERFVTAGTRPISDLYQQQANVASARSGLVESRRAREVAKLDLIQTLQLDPAQDYAFEAPTVDPAAVTARRWDLDSLVTRALAQRVDIDAEEARVEAAEAGVRAARGGYWPSVSVSAGYNTSYNSLAEQGFQDQLDQRRGGSVSLGLSVPLWDRGNAALGAQRARIQEQNAEITLAARRQEVALEVRRAWLDQQAAQERLAAAEAQKRAADLAVDASSRRYEVGAATLVEVSQARATQVQAASAVVSARYNLVFQQSLMSYYTGELDPARVNLGG